MQEWKVDENTQADQDCQPDPGFRANLQNLDIVVKVWRSRSGAAAMQGLASFEELVSSQRATLPH